MKRQDGVDFNSSLDEIVPKDNSESLANQAELDQPTFYFGTERVGTESTPRIETPDSPGPVLKKTVSDGVMLPGGRSRKDLSCQTSEPARKAVTFTKQDRLAQRPPRICRTPTPYTRLDSADAATLEEETPETEPEADAQTHIPAKHVLSAP